MMKYFISFLGYQSNDKKEAAIFVNGEITTRAPIGGIKTLKMIEEKLAADHGFERVGILFWRKWE